MHKIKVQQAVVGAHNKSRQPEVYEVVRLLPALPNGEPQYRIKGRESGIERVVREGEIRALFE